MDIRRPLTVHHFLAKFGIKSAGVGEKGGPEHRVSDGVFLVQVDRFDLLTWVRVRVRVTVRVRVRVAVRVSVRVSVIASTSPGLGCRVSVRANSVSMQVSNRVSVRVQV